MTRTTLFSAAALMLIAVPYGASANLAAAPLDAPADESPLVRTRIALLDADPALATDEAAEQADGPVAPLRQMVRAAWHDLQGDEATEAPTEEPAEQESEAAGKSALPDEGCCCGPCRHDCFTQCWEGNPCGGREWNCRQQPCDKCGRPHWVCDGHYCDVYGCDGPANESALRMGWWGVSTDGSPTQVGEFQSLRPSPFLELDALLTDGVSTLNFTGNFLDHEASDVSAQWYRGTTKIEVDFDRYERRLYHDPLNNFLGVFRQAPNYTANPDGTFTLVNPGNTNRSVLRQDLNVGEDYAIRVEQLQSSISGQLNENWRYRVRVWGLRKFGERQANAAAHCFNSTLVAPGEPADPAIPAGRACHVLSRSQQIDWLTEEVEPSVEGRVGPFTVQYSHLVRAFFQDDQALSRYYNSDAPSRALTNPGGPLNGAVPADYAATPENLTHIGQLKIGTQLSDTTDVYALVLGGETTNRNRNTDRSIAGGEIRLTDRTDEDFTHSVYSKVYGEWNDFPPFLRPDESGNPYIAPTPWLNTTYPNGFVRAPWDYVRTTAGLRSSWQPYGDPDAWRLTGGYEFISHDRRHAEFEAVVPNSTPTDPDVTTHEEFAWGTTTYHTVNLRASRRLTRWFDGYLGYTHRWIDNPMFAVHEPNGTTNSNLPNSEDLVQLGGSWYPTNYFLWSGWVGIENRSADNQYANFAEDDYPLGTTIWCALTERWHVSGGYAYFSNWIDQDITLGDQIGGFRNAENRIHLAPITTQFSYGGRAHVINLGTDYLLTSKVIVTGGLEFVDGRDAFEGPAEWPDLGDFSAVDVTTWRYSLGLDYSPYQHTNWFCRYIYFDYEDANELVKNGTAATILAGVSIVR